MVPRVASAGVPSLAHDERAEVVERHLSADQLPGHHLLRRAEAEEAGEQPRRRRSGDPEPVREARDPASGAGAPRRRRGRCGPRQRLRRDDVQGPARGARDHLLLVLRGGPGTSGPRAEVPGHRRTLQRQLLHEAREGPRRELEGLVDAGRDRLRDHLEVSELHPPGRQFGRRVLLRRAGQQLPAGRHRHEDVAHREEHAQHDHLEGHLRGIRPQHVSRPGADPQGRHERPQLQPVRFPPDWFDVRRVHLPGHPGPGADRADGARSVDLEDRRGTALLLPGARHHAGRRDEHDCERLLQAGLPQAPDGVRGRGPETDWREPEPRGHGRVSAPRGPEGTTMLEIKDLHVKVAGKEILKGIDLSINDGEVHAVMGPNGSGKTTLAQVLAGRVTYEVTGGTARFEGKDLLAMKPEDRAREGVFMAFQYPVEIPGVSNAYFLKAALNAIRKYRGQDEIDAMDFVTLVQDKAKLLGLDETFMKRGLNEGFSGGEKKKNEVFQMAVLEPKFCVLDETDSGLDIDALRVVANGINAMRSPKRAMLVVTHYQRLLDYVVPDFVHVLVDGKIVKSGDADLARNLEKHGYGWILEETPRPPQAARA